VRKPGFGLLLLLLVGCESAPEAPLEVPIGTEPGQRAPALRGRTASGEAFSLSATPAAPTAIVFYRGAHCGLCRVQLEELQQFLVAFRRQGTHLLAVTLDSPELSHAYAEQVGLELDLISVDPPVFVEWGVMSSEDDLPNPGTYLVGRDGVIRYRHIGRNAADRTTAPELVTLIEDLFD
jgi:peroxiredoxin